VGAGKWTLTLGVLVSGGRVRRRGGTTGVGKTTLAHLNHIPGDQKREAGLKEGLSDKIRPETGGVEEKKTASGWVSRKLEGDNF